MRADGNLLPTPFLDVRSRLVPLMPEYDERGLLGLAFHPGYAANGRFVFYSARTGSSTFRSATAEARTTCGSVTSRTGARANAGGNGQGIQRNVLGNILRIDVDRGAPYAIPADNPFAATPGCADGCVRQ